jgi:uncharacterized protein (DUF3820 family)
MQEVIPDAGFLDDLKMARMPFGKYKNQLLLTLPEAYLLWFQRQGFPKNKLGTQLAFVLELKINGLEKIIF